MMTQRVSRFFVVLATTLVVAGLTSSPAFAGFVDQLESLQQQKGPIHQFRFEGATAATRRTTMGRVPTCSLQSAKAAPARTT